MTGTDVMHNTRVGVRVKLGRFRRYWKTCIATFEEFAQKPRLVANGLAPVNGHRPAARPARASGAASTQTCT